MAAGVGVVALTHSARGALADPSRSWCLIIVLPFEPQ